MRKLLQLIQFFTRIPINKSFDYSMDSFKKTNSFLVLTGVIIGIILLIPSYVMFFLNISNPRVEALLLLTFYIFLTGAFHLDGLSDTADGIFSGRSRERILEIMKDSRIGSYGTIAMILDILFKYVIFLDIFAVSKNNFQTLLLFLILPVSGKYGLSLLGHTGTRAKADSSGNYFINNSDLSDLLINSTVFLITIGIISFFVFSMVDAICLVILSFISILLLVIIFNSYFNKKIGGIVGDNLGFIAEISEIIVGIIIILSF